MKHLIGHLIDLPHMGQSMPGITAPKNKRRALVIDVRLTAEEEGAERLAIQGTIWTGPNPEKCRDADSSGQIVEEVAQILTWEANDQAELYGGFVYADGWDRARLAKLVAIWRLYHLNDMQPGCEHQRMLGWYDVHKLWQTKGMGTDVVGMPCPICDYKFGTEWRYLWLPSEVLAFVEPLAREEVSV